MELSDKIKLEILQLDRETIDNLYNYVFEIQNRVDKLLKDDKIESKSFQQWLIHFRDFTIQKEVVENNSCVSRFFVNTGIQIREFEDCQLMYVMESDLDSYNGESVICEFDGFGLFKRAIESINPRYLLTDKRVYKIERVPKKNFWGTIKGFNIIEKESFAISDIDLSERSHRLLFWDFLRVYSDYENDLWISEFESSDLFVLSNLDGFLNFIPKDELKQFLKINYEIEKMITLFNHDRINIRKFKHPGVSFKVPLKINSFQPGDGWDLNKPLLSIINDFRIKSLIISYCIMVRNLFMYSIVNNDEVNKYKYFLLLEQHGLLESYFEKMTRNALSTSSSRIISELKQINQTIDEINSQMGTSDELKSSINSIDNTLKFNFLVNAYSAYKLS